MSTNPLHLYRAMLRDAQKFNSFNFREYASRRIRTDFRKNQTLTDKDDIARAIEFGIEQAKLLKRQALINRLYAHDDLINVNN